MKEKGIWKHFKIENFQMLSIIFVINLIAYVAHKFLFQNKVITLYNAILRIARNLLETRENIKIESHSFYHIICDKFSWGSI